MGSLTTCPSRRWKRLINVNQGLDPVTPGRDQAQALDRVTRGREVDDGLLIRPKTVHVDAEDLLRLGAFVDLEPRLFLRVRREHDEQSPVEREPAELTVEADTNLGCVVFPGIVSGRGAGALCSADDARTTARKADVTARHLPHAFDVTSESWSM